MESAQLRKGGFLQRKPETENEKGRKGKKEGERECKRERGKKREKRGERENWKHPVPLS